MNLCVLVCFQLLAFDVVRANNDAALLHKLHSDEEHLRTLVVLLSLTGGLALSFALGIGIFLYWHVREYKRRRQRRLRRRHEKLMSLTTAIHHPTPSHPYSDEEDDIIIQAPVQPLATSSPVSLSAAVPCTPETHVADLAEEEVEAENVKEEDEDEAYHSSISKTPAISSSPVPPTPATESARETAPPSAPSAKELLITSSSSRMETNAEASSSSATSCCPHCPSPFMVSTTLMDTVDPPPPAYQQVDTRSRDEGPLVMLYDPETAAAASFVANQPIYSNQN